MSPTAPSRTASLSRATSMVACGSGRAVCGDGDAADEGFTEGEGVAAELGNGFEDVDGFAGDFGADAVAGQDCDVQVRLRASHVVTTPVPSRDSGTAGERVSE